MWHISISGHIYIGNLDKLAYCLNHAHRLNTFQGCNMVDKQISYLPFQMYMPCDVDIRHYLHIPILLFRSGYIYSPHPIIEHNSHLLGPLINQPRYIPYLTMQPQFHELNLRQRGLILCRLHY